MPYAEIPEEARQGVEAELASFFPPSMDLEPEEVLALREMAITAMDTVASHVVMTDAGLPDGPTVFDLETLDDAIELLTWIRGRLAKLEG